MKKSEYEARYTALTKEVNLQESQLRMLADTGNLLMSLKSAEEKADLALAAAARLNEANAGLEALDQELRQGKPALIVGHVYRAAAPRQVGWSVNDRQILHIDRLGWELQYDSPSVRMGSLHTRLRVTQFLLWVGEDVTDGYPPGDWMDWSVYVKQRENAKLPYANGKLAFESGLKLDESNPYPKSIKAHAEFVRGFVEAQALVAA